MKRLQHVIILLALTAATILPVSAQEHPADVRPVSAAYTVGIGSSHIADTYLSQLRYSGWSAALGYNRRQTTPFSPQWQYRIDGRLSLSHAGAPRGSSSLWHAGIELLWGLERRWQLPHGITLAAGGAVEGDAGCIYNTSNGNNPASAKVALTLDATARAEWRTRIGRLPVTVSYQPSLPVIGAFFAPEYDELYYEIYLGNRHGLAHCAWWGSRFKMNNLVAIDLHLSRTALRVGLDATVMSSSASHITTDMTMWRLVIGVSGNWISL